MPAMHGHASFGPQAGPLTRGGGDIVSSTSANVTSSFVGHTTDVYQSFIFGTRAARRGAPP